MTTDDEDLGGFFYDYLVAADGTMIGIRYYFFDDVELNLDSHPVFQPFLTDYRFQFDLDKLHVDILLKISHINEFEGHSFKVDEGQHFGGTHVIKTDDGYGLMIEV
ncbi:hypothetical protein [Ottowia thiooxydans]|uniref:hypothetical protein n=1 Tax=Ottowia thiooxydans TaxID=219182 RepID=UPI003393450B